MNTRSMLLAAGIAGTVMGVISGFPVINWVNCCCFAGLWGSGILAVLVYRQINRDQPGLTITQGLVLGLATGLAGAVLATVLSLLSSLIFTGMNAASSLEMLDQVPGLSESIPEASRELVTQFGSAMGGTAVGGMCKFITYPLFGLIGAFIGTGLIWKK